MEEFMKAIPSQDAIKQVLVDHKAKTDMDGIAVIKNIIKEATFPYLIGIITDILDKNSELSTTYP